MPNSKEVRRLTARWATGTGWPKRLEWIQIKGLRGWQGEMFHFKYPIMAIVAENGVGKSTLLQCVSALYKSKPPKRAGRKRQAKKESYASDHFPDTAWDKIRNATIGYQVRQGSSPPIEGTIRKPGGRWRGYKARPERQVVYIDLSRIQPISARGGYLKLAKPKWKEKSFTDFDKGKLSRLGQIMGREYETAKMSYTDADETRPVPVLGHSGHEFSGFHMGAGETVLAELLQVEIPQYSIVLIDEIESSLHPRLQRRLIRDLAELTRQMELQVVLTTHSPFILEELPNEARAQILQDENTGARTIVYGITPEFAVTKMDDVSQYECDLYVEDENAERMLIEIIVTHSSDRDFALRCRTIKYGLASVGQQLGLMAHQHRFPRPSFVFLDGDLGPSPGCISLPGEDSPERVVFDALRGRNWQNLSERTGRKFSETADACMKAMTLPDHHEWIRYAADKLVLGGDVLRQAMCAEWATNCLSRNDAMEIVQPVEDALNKVLTTFTPPVVVMGRPEALATERTNAKADEPSSEGLLPFEQSPDAEP